jgi:hypothetical protein
MSERLVLVVDHAVARIFRLAAPGAAPDELGRLDNPAGHGHERDLGASRPGRTAGGGGSRHAFEAPHTLRQHAAEVFAQRAAAALVKARGGSAVPVVLVAGPELLGLVRPHLASISGLQEWPHNLANLPDPELRQHLQSLPAAIS